MKKKQNLFIKFIKEIDLIEIGDWAQSLIPNFQLNLSPYYKQFKKNIFLLKNKYFFFPIY